MIFDDESEEMQFAVKKLDALLSDHIGNTRVTMASMHRMVEIIKEHHAWARIQGIDFPVLRALIVPRLNVVKLVRADLDRKSIYNQINNFQVDYPAATVDEVRKAFKSAFPDFKFDLVPVNRKFIFKANPE